MAANLQHLLATQEWESFREGVEDLERKQIDHLITATADWRYIQGRIDGIREALRLPLQLIARARRQ